MATPKLGFDSNILYDIQDSLILPSESRATARKSSSFNKRKSKTFEKQERGGKKPRKSQLVEETA